MSTYWITDSLQRVRPQSAAGSGETITLYIARREIRSCQLHVRPTGTAKRTVIVTDDDGLTVSLHKEQYVNLTTGSAQDAYYANYCHGEGPGWYPDGLTPLENGEEILCTDGVNQSVWVDIEVPPTMAAGTKTVSITWSSGSFTITVIVGDFSLPERPRMGSLFRYRNVHHDEAANAVLREHRLMPYYTHVADSRHQDWVACSFYTSVNKSTCEAQTDPPTAQAVADKAALYDPLPDGTTLYSYCCDEPGGCVNNEDFKATMQTYAERLDAEGILALITMPPTAGWEFVDICVVLCKLHNQAAVDAWVAAGRKCWAYQCLNQEKYSPKWFVDMQPMNYRIFGFLMQAMKLSGLLYWACDDWSADPWNDVELEEQWGTTKPGEGMLVYPATGTPNGDFPGTVLPSIRLKQFRDASQDYDLVWLAKDKGLFTGDVAAAVAAVGSGYAWGYWTQDPAVIIAAQEALEIALSPPPTPPTAAFSADVVAGTAPLTVEFTDDSSASPTSWHWHFGDGGESDLQSPSHEYQNAGTYTVTLWATNDDGTDEETKANYISVSVAPSPPVAGFSASPTTGAPPLEVTFTDQSSGATSWHYAFGDGGESELQSPTHEYQADGRYTVTQTVYNATDQDSQASVDIVVVSTPIAPPPRSHERGRGHHRRR